ncbi:hypothetical protein [Prevotella scopos]|nr:hypothetical protein [Prevotella scopos]
MEKGEKIVRKFNVLTHFECDSVGLWLIWSTFAGNKEFLRQEV